MIQDLLWAVRWLRKSPLFTLAVMLILALGIGANTAVFSIVDAVLLRPLPYADPSRLVRIAETSTKTRVGITAQDYQLWGHRDDLFDRTAAWLKDVVTLTNVDAPDQLVALRSTGGLFPLLGVHARLGRTLLDSDGASNAPNVLVLSDHLWRRLYHADPGVIGRKMTLSDEVFTVVGVMAPEFEFPDSGFDLWTQLRLTPATTAWVQVVARLKAGVPLSQVQSALAIVARQLEQQEPQKRAGLQIDVSPWREVVARQYELTLVFVLAAVGLVLLIACANVGSLLLSRAVQRQREIAIRASLGADFWRLLRQLLAESLVLAVLGSAAGIVTAHYVLQVLLKQLAALPLVVPHMQRVALNGRVLLFDMALCLLLAGICSLAPVLFTSKTDLQTVLRSGQGTSGVKGSTRLFSFLIASEAAFAFLLLVSSGLMVRSLIRLQQADRGFQPDHVLTMRVPIGTLTQPRPTGKYDSRPRQIAYYHDLLDRVERIPGVKDAAVVNNLPLSGFSTSTVLQGPTRTISPRYFSAMGIPLLSGRAFSEADQAGAPPVVIVNQYLAHQLFPDRDPVGQRLPTSENNNPPTIVGIVKDSSQTTYDQAVKGELYIPYRQFIFGTFLSTIVIRTAGDPLSLAPALRKEVWAVDPNQPILKIETMNDVVADSIWRPRFSAWIFSVLGGLALLLTSSGVYGVVAYTSSLRVKEVGIRVALGATPQNVVAVIVRSALLPLLAGLGVSIIAALALSRVLASLLYEISSTDPVSYVGAGILLLAIGVAASARPAWRAAVADPLQALRME